MSIQTKTLAATIIRQYQQGLINQDEAWHLLANLYLDELNGSV